MADNLVLLTCEVSSVQVFLWDQLKKLKQKTICGVTCVLHILYGKLQADAKSEGSFINSGVKLRCAIFPRSL